MKNVDMIRVWKDKSYKASLTADQLAQVEANPAGKLSSVEQNMVSGGNGRLTSDWAFTCGWGDEEMGCGDVH